MHVLITRPERDAADLKSRIAALGCEVTVAPLLDIQFCEIALDAFDGASGLIATSRNGLKALAKSPALARARALPVFVVGPATAALARDLGFKMVHEGAGTAADLVPIISAHAAHAVQRLIHLAGDHLAFDLAEALEPAGIAIRSLEVYRSGAATTLTDPVQNLLRAGKIDAVILMSPRSSQIWADLVRSLPDQPDLNQLQHICLSDAVARCLQPIQPVKVEIAASPTTDEIIALVYRLAGKPQTG